MSKANEELREALAAYAHEAWSGWMNYQFSKAPLNDDGSWTMPAYFVERWHRQMTTKFSQLPESEKASDRDEADKMLAILYGDGKQLVNRDRHPFGLKEVEERR